MSDEKERDEIVASSRYAATVVEDEVILRRLAEDREAMAAGGLPADDEIPFEEIRGRLRARVPR